MIASLKCKLIMRSHYCIINELEPLCFQARRLCLRLCMAPRRCRSDGSWPTELSSTSHSSPRHALTLAPACHVLTVLQTGIAGVAGKAVELKIKEALDSVVLSHQHPRSAISVTIQVLHDDGAVRVDIRLITYHNTVIVRQLLACAVNAATLALIDAGVPMKAVVAAASVAVLPDLGLVLDPTHAEEKACEFCSMSARCL